jgi:Cu(I)/Ag(I) efflux system membrane fusion protein
MSDHHRTGWQKAKLIFKVVEVRLRFVAILAAVGFFVGYWDDVKNHWEKLTRPDGLVYSATRSVAGKLTAEWLWPSGQEGETPQSDREYFCPMHPHVVRPGRDPDGAIPKCPICGMPLSLRKKGETPALPEEVLSRKQFSPEQIRLAGIKTVEVSYQPLARELSAVGNVVFDESRRSRIVSRVAGYLEKLYLDRNWMAVREGDPLAEIYSPELYSAVSEYLLASEKSLSADLARSARERLVLLGLGDREIDEVSKSGRAKPRLVLRSPRSGHVTRKEVLAGDRVEAGQTLFEVADLSRLSIEAEVFEAESEFLREGQSVEASVDALPNRTFTGQVSLVHPHLESSTRTNTVRFEVDNPEHKLRPGMFATVRINTPLSELEPFATTASQPASGTPPHEGKVLAVPERSVIDTGTKKVVYLEREPGLFEGREVQLGPRAGEFYSVVAGLVSGDRVAERGSFLIDAETRLNPAAAGTYAGAGGGPQSPRPGSPAGSNRPPGGGDSKAGATGAGSGKPSAEGLKNLDGLPAAEREIALAQKNCPISGEPLGSMGVPIKVMVKGQVVFLCCQGCRGKVESDPDGALKKAAELKGIR